MHQNKGVFRFTFFTHQYKETCGFYSNQRGLTLEENWDRSDMKKTLQNV